MHRFVKLVPKFIRTLIFGMIESEFGRVTAVDVDNLKIALLSRIAGILDL
jgi:hypothetical protein